MTKFNEFVCMRRFNRLVVDGFTCRISEAISISFLFSRICYLGDSCDKLAGACFFRMQTILWFDMMLMSVRTFLYQFYNARFVYSLCAT